MLGEWDRVIATFRAEIQQTFAVLTDDELTAVAAAAVGLLKPERCGQLAGIAEQAPLERRWTAFFFLSWCGPDSAPAIRRARDLERPDRRDFLTIALAAALPAAHAGDAADLIRATDPELLPQLMSALQRVPTYWPAILPAFFDKLARQPGLNSEMAAVVAVAISRSAVNPDPRADQRLLELLPRLARPAQMEAAAVLLEARDASVRDSLVPWLAGFCQEQRASGGDGVLLGNGGITTPTDRLWMAVAPRPTLRVTRGATMTHFPAGGRHVGYVCPQSPGQEMGYMTGDITCLRRSDPEYLWVQRGMSLARIRATGSWR